MNTAGAKAGQELLEGGALPWGPRVVSSSCRSPSINIQLQQDSDAEMQAQLEPPDAGLQAQHAPPDAGMQAQHAPSDPRGAAAM
eukprot:1146656-Pelagomonas_calceolata.AAC.8